MIPLGPVSTTARIAGPTPYVGLGFLVFFTLVPTPLVIVSALGGRADGPPLLFVAAWIAILVWCWFAALVLFTYEIRLSTGGEIEFKSVLRTIRMDAHELVSIGPRSVRWDPNFIVFKSRTRSARTVRAMDGLHALLGELQALNPELELRGL